MSGSIPEVFLHWKHGGSIKFMLSLAQPLSLQTPNRLSLQWRPYGNDGHQPKGQVCTHGEKRGTSWQLMFLEFKGHRANKKLQYNFFVRHFHTIIEEFYGLLCNLWKNIIRGFLLVVQFGPYACKQQSGCEGMPVEAGQHYQKKTILNMLKIIPFHTTNQKKSRLHQSTSCHCRCPCPGD